ncbi:MAG: aspartyl protease family protein [Leptolyngbyaceae cyanobacterium]
MNRTVPWVERSPHREDIRVPSFPYQELEPGLPPVPIIPIEISPPDWAPPTNPYDLDAFLDTGSDCTLIPLEVLSILQLKLVESNVPITGVGGGEIQGFACYINLRIGDLQIQAVRAYGRPANRLSQRVLVGRDVLNQCCIRFDGIQQEVHFITQ